MKLVVIGGGYVGLTAAACFASSKDAHVVCLEADASRVEELRCGKCPIREPDLESLIVRGLSSGRLTFTTQEQEANREADLFVLAVGTPPLPDGAPDLRQLRRAVKAIGKHLEKSATIIIIPPGGTKAVQEWFVSMLYRSDSAVDVIYCPEFLREGHAVSDFCSPERIVIGGDKPLAVQKALAIYRLCQVGDPPVICISARNAELIKYASNGFLALKVAFINELDELCEASGGDIRTVTAGMGADTRIGEAYLRTGIGYGGMCLPKDTQGLIWYARTVNSAMPILEQVIRSNTAHLEWIVNQIIEIIPGNATIGVWGLTFKANTDDLRNSPAIALIKAISKCGDYCFQLYDSTVHTSQIDMLKDINHTCLRRPEDVAQNANVLLIAVAWEEFKEISLERVKYVMRKGLVFDLCLLRSQDLPDIEGVSYIQLG